MESAGKHRDSPSTWPERAPSSAPNLQNRPSRTRSRIACCGFWPIQDHVRSRDCGCAFPSCRLASSPETGGGPGPGQRCADRRRRPRIRCHRRRKVPWIPPSSYPRRSCPGRDSSPRCQQHRHRRRPSPTGQWTSSPRSRCRTAARGRCCEGREGRANASRPTRLPSARTRRRQIQPLTTTTTTTTILGRDPRSGAG